MHRLAKLGSVVFTAALMTYLAGCAAPKAPTTGCSQSPAPEWVNKGSGAFKDAQGGSVFYGVGVADHIKMVGLARTTANERGRAEISRIMNSYVTTLGKDYAASTTAGDKTSEEQFVSQTSKVFSKFTLIGATPVDLYIDRCDPGNTVYYSLVKLDMASVKKSLDESKELDAKMRDFVKANSEKAFDELAAEEAKGK